MDLYEVEGKRLMGRYGIPVDRGFLWTGESRLDQVRFPCVLKAQVLSGKRGKAGGICFAGDEAELRRGLAQIERARVDGKSAQAVYVTDRVRIAREHYLGLTLDPAQKAILLIYTPEGGMNIEELAAERPAALLRLPLTFGLDPADLAGRLRRMGLTEAEGEAVAGIAEKLLQMFWELDATTVEINPLAQLEDGSFLAVDAKVVLDDNALFRHEDCTLLSRESSLTPREKAAKAYGLAYVELDDGGDIGLIAGGAGIGMATVDTIYFYGGRPFDFLDLGGGVTAEKTYQAMRLLLETPQVKGILVNVFGGGNHCGTMAEGVARAVRELGGEKTVVVKSRGFYQEAGWKIYDELGLKQVHYGTTDQAVQLLLKEMEGAK